MPQAASEWKQQPDAAWKLAKLQTDIRERFLRAFAGGMAVFDFVRDDLGNGTYRLTEARRLAPYLEQTDHRRPL